MGTRIHNAKGIEIWKLVIKLKAKKGEKYESAIFELRN